MVQNVGYPECQGSSFKIRESGRFLVFAPIIKAFSEGLEVQGLFFPILTRPAGMSGRRNLPARTWHWICAMAVEHNERDEIALETDESRVESKTLPCLSL